MIVTIIAILSPGWVMRETAMFDSVFSRWICRLTCQGR